MSDIKQIIVRHWQKLLNDWEEQILLNNDPIRKAYAQMQANICRYEILNIDSKTDN